MKKVQVILIVLSLFFGSLSNGMQREVSGTQMFSTPTKLSEPAILTPEKPIRPRPKRRLIMVPETEPDISSAEAQIAGQSPTIAFVMNRSREPILVVYNTNNGLASKILSRYREKGHFNNDVQMVLQKGPILVSLDCRYYALIYDANNHTVAVRLVLSGQPGDSVLLDTIKLPETPQDRRVLTLTIQSLGGDTKSPFVIAPY